jgi:hypothetical protein
MIKFVGSSHLSETLICNQKTSVRYKSGNIKIWNSYIDQLGHAKLKCMKDIEKTCTMN